MKHFKIIFVLAVTVAMFLGFSFVSSAEEDSEADKHYFYIYESPYTRTQCFVEGSDVVAVFQCSGGCYYEYSKHFYETKSEYSPSICFFRLNSDRSGVEISKPRKYKTFKFEDGDWILSTDWSDSNYPYVATYSSTIDYKYTYWDFENSDIDLLEVNLDDRGAIINKSSGEVEYKSESHSLTTNLYSYLLNGTFTDFGKNYVFRLHENMLDVVPVLYRSSGSTIPNCDIVLSAEYDAESGTVSWSDFVTDDANTLTKGVIATLYWNNDGAYGTTVYRSVLTGTSYELSFGGCNFSGSDGRYKSITFYPYYVHANGYIYIGKGTSIQIDEDSVAATRVADKMLTATARTNNKPSVIYPDKGDSYINPDIINENAVYSSELGYINGLSFSIDSGYDRGFPYIMSYKLTWNTSAGYDNTYIQLRSEGLLTYVDDTNTKRQKKVNFDLLTYNDKVNYLNGIVFFPMEDVKPLAKAYFSDYESYKENALLVRLVRFNESTNQYECGGWTRISLDSGEKYNMATGDYDDYTGTFTKDTESSDSYDKNMNFDGTYSDASNSSGGSIDLPNLDSLGWFTSTLSSIISALGSVPQFFATIFGFLPSAIIALIGVLIALCVILRILGR